jgi:hypothetical protein
LLLFEDILASNLSIDKITPVNDIL